MVRLARISDRCSNACGTLPSCSSRQHETKPCSPRCGSPRARTAARDTGLHRRARTNPEAAYRAPRTRAQAEDGPVSQAAVVVWGIGIVSPISTAKTAKRNPGKDTTPKKEAGLDANNSKMAGCSAFFDARVGGWLAGPHLPQSKFFRWLRTGCRCHVGSRIDYGINGQAPNYALPFSTPSPKCSAMYCRACGEGSGWE